MHYNKNMGIKNLWAKIKNTLFKGYKNTYEFFWIGAFEGNAYLCACHAIDEERVFSGMTRKQFREEVGKPTTIEKNAMGMPVLKCMQSYQGYTEWWAFTFSFEGTLLFYEYENDQIFPEKWWKVSKWDYPWKRMP